MHFIFGVTRSLRGASLSLSLPISLSVSLAPFLIDTFFLATRLMEELDGVLSGLDMPTPSSERQGEDTTHPEGGEGGELEAETKEIVKVKMEVEEEEGKEQEKRDEREQRDGGEKRDEEEQESAAGHAEPVLIFKSEETLFPEALLAGADGDTGAAILSATTLSTPSSPPPRCSSALSPHAGASSSPVATIPVENDSKEESHTPRASAIQPSPSSCVDRALQQGATTDDAPRESLLSGPLAARGDENGVAPMEH